VSKHGVKTSTARGIHSATHSTSVEWCSLSLPLPFFASSSRRSERADDASYDARTAQSVRAFSYAMPLASRSGQLLFPYH